VLDGGFISYAYKSISNDAWLINHAGIVRGGMQRVFSAGTDRRGFFSGAENRS
jgi:hypothetical protein